MDSKETRLLYLGWSGKLMSHTPHPDAMQGAEHHFMFPPIPHFDLSEFGFLFHELIFEGLDLRPEATFSLFGCNRLNEG